MAEPFIGEIMLAGFNFAPQNYATANGALLPIRQYTALFSLIGTSFGGNGQVTFGLPDLAARVPCGVGQGPGRTPRSVGDEFGSAQVQLTMDEMPTHTHALSGYYGRSITQQAVPTSTSALSLAKQTNVYNNGAVNAAMAPLSITPSGTGAPHENRQPYLGINYCIALNGLFPSFG